MAMIGKRAEDMIMEMTKYIFDNHQIDVMNTKRRHEPVVISRAALFNACRGLMTSTQLGGYFGMNHATVLHHQKNHEGLLMIAYYRQLYFELMRIRATHDEVAKEYQDDILKQLEDFKKRYEILEWKYQQLKAKQGEEVNT
jgi:hypothetical protein